MKKTRAMAAAAGLMGSWVALGAEGGAAANPMSFQAAPFVSALVVFGVAAWVLGKFVWPKIEKGLSDREAKIRNEIAGAEEARKQAAAALAQYERSLAEARAEAGAMLEKTKGEQQKLASELRAKADAELAAMRDRATKEIETAKKEAINEIYAQAVTIAAEMAAKALKREVSAADHKRLIEESLRELEGAGSR